MRIAMLAATVLGLVLAVWLIGSVGIGPVLEAVTSIGLIGFAVLCLWSLVILVILGLAWYVVAPGEPPARAWTFAWGRTTREAASDVLPFSQIGGLIVGARTVSALGVRDSIVHASMVVDMTTEMGAQLLFTLLGVGLLVLRLGAGSPDHDLTLAVGGALCVAFLTTLGFILAQSHGIALLERIALRLLPRAVAAAGEVKRTLGLIYRRPVRVFASFLLNMLGWLASGVAAWIALCFMGIEISLWAVIAVESLILAVRSAAFVIPGALGVQEAAYVLIAPLFGLDPEVALALSLLKRARDTTIGVPVLLVWQAFEGRRLLRDRQASAR